MTHQTCYGNLFRSSGWHRSGNQPADSVFAFSYRQPGTVRFPPEISVDLEAWDRCMACLEFSTCLQLSTAKITLEAAVRG